MYFCTKFEKRFKNRHFWSSDAQTSYIVAIYLHFGDIFVIYLRFGDIFVDISPKWRYLSPFWRYIIGFWRYISDLYLQNGDISSSLKDIIQRYISYISLLYLHFSYFRAKIYLSPTFSTFFINNSWTICKKIYLSFTQN